jgi:hypothetical protein
MVYVISAFLFGTACAAAVLFAADRALKKGNPDATEPTPSGRQAGITATQYVVRAM